MITEKERKDDLMILEFTNGDIEKFDKVMKKYNFVNAQALIRYAVSILQCRTKYFMSTCLPCLARYLMFCGQRKFR